ncbi:dephospho-CoA kinase [Aureimonas sp. SA4125]|uniref:dephospho-CoA kinase n=1 Tax=Aureimonas sp. SA4125 TaxID=2826993 RepID=UPI001CC3BC6B|nr:dephospho-CoA kinase [Aureimonas sp. SA4125]BDA86859.1 dephospho-CoA kinase [Aureimonas sp. SA4125]
MLVLGLTGSIGMGKSATAAMAEAAGIPVHSADAAVHRLYAGPLAAPIEALFPGTTRDGVVDREALARRVLGDPRAMMALEALVHPMVRAEEAAFLDACRAVGEKLVLLDVPLLFESGRTGAVDRILVVSAPAAVQRERVLARPGMTVEKFEAILARQMPDAEKRAKADYVIDTSKGLAAAERDLHAIIADLLGHDRRT